MSLQDRDYVRNHPFDQRLAERRIDRIRARRQRDRAEARRRQFFDRAAMWLSLALILYIVVFYG
jgi:hypothetical protein